MVYEMSDLKNRIAELDAKLDAMVEASAKRLQLLAFEIELSLEDVDRVQVGLRLDPHVYDPNGEMRRLYAERQRLDRELTERQDRAS